MSFAVCKEERGEKWGLQSQDGKKIDGIYCPFVKGAMRLRITHAHALCRKKSDSDRWNSLVSF